MARKRGHGKILNYIASLADDSGIITAKAVVKDAKREESPLHKHFEWNDTKAARDHRLEQARALIRSVNITVDLPEPTQVRAMVSVPTDRLTGGGYRTLESVLSKKSLRHALAADIMRKAEIWEKKAEEIGVLVNMADLKKTGKRLARK